MRKQRRRRNNQSIHHAIYGLFLVLFLQVRPVAQSQDCGQTDWKAIKYEYYAGEHSAPDSALVVDTHKTGNSAVLLIYRPLEHQPFAGGPPSYFATTDSGVTWEGKQVAPPSSLARPATFLRSPSDRQIQYKRVEGLDLYVRSQDGGAHWILPEYRVDGFSKEEFAAKIGGNNTYHLQIYINAVDPLHPLTLYASLRVIPWTSADTTEFHELKAVYVSTDGGEHWAKFSDRLATFGNSFQNTYPIGISPFDPKMIYAVGTTENGIAVVKSTDGGKSWQTPGLPQSELTLSPEITPKTPKWSHLRYYEFIGVAQFVFDPKDANVVYVVTGKGIFRTIDGGSSWRMLDVGFYEINAINSMAVNPLDQKQIFVGSRYGIFRSDNGGCTFHKVFPGAQEARK